MISHLHNVYIHVLKYDMHNFSFLKTKFDAKGNYTHQGTVTSWVQYCMICVVET